jgi:hypothetical protein
MNQSIEDASRIDHLDMVLAANRAAGCNRPQSCDYFTGDFNLTVFLEEMLKLIEARQSSQSEPVAEFTDEQLAMFSDNADRYNLTNAAPQQAIPSGLIETLKFYANKANYKTSWDSDSNHVMEDKGEIARNALAAYESAAPTAPIESDK